jgi:chromosome segregation ATPase
MTPPLDPNFISPTGQRITPETAPCAVVVAVEEQPLSEYEQIAAEVAARRANPPARNTALAAKLFQSDESYFGQDTLTPQRAEIARLRGELALKQEAIELLRDCLTEAEQENAAQRQRIEDLQCQVLSAQPQDHSTPA